MKKGMAAVLALSILLALFVPAALAAEPEESTGLIQAAGDLLSDLGEKIRNGGKDLWSALREYLSEHSTSEVAEHLRLIFRETETLTDEELRQELKTVTGQLNISLSDSQLDLLVKLFRKLEKLDVDELRRQAEEWKNSIPDWDDVERTLDRLEEIGQRAQETAREARGLLGKVRSFFQKIHDFFDGLF